MSIFILLTDLKRMLIWLRNIKTIFLIFSHPDLSLAVPVANSLTFLCTLLTGKALGEEFGGKRKWLIFVRLKHKPSAQSRGSHTACNIDTHKDKSGTLRCYKL